MSGTIAFVLASTPFGSVIVNRSDYTIHESGKHSISVGACLLSDGDYEPGEANNGAMILAALARTRGPGVLAIDGGANIGLLSLYWAGAMTGWGEVIAIEPQRRVYYALCGNLALNNVGNADAVNVALSDQVAPLMVPDFDYSTPFASGSISLLDDESAPPLASKSDRKVPVSGITVDSMELERLDFLKLDIEGMELLAIDGARETIARCKPVLMVEHLFSPQQAIKARLPGYVFRADGQNTLCFPAGDPLLDIMTIKQPAEAA